MRYFVKSGLAVAAVCLWSMSTASAGGLLERGSSMKDTMPSHHGSVSRCYVRGDVGYSVAGDVDMEVSSPLYTQTSVTGSDIDGAWMGEIGAGCGSGSRGFRADFTLGYRSEQDVSGYKTDRPGFHFPGDLSSKISTLTAMANVYYDFGLFRNIVPYVGVGIGVAHHDLSDISFSLVNTATLAPAPSNNLSGSTETNFAWSLMAGAAYQISERAVLDVGYRYINLGDVSSQRGHICSTSCGTGSNDQFSTDDITAHEFKVGLRFHFGGGRTATYK